MTPFYLIFNFLCYRVLLSKAKVYDGMRQYERYHQITYYLLHVLYVLVALFGLYSTFFLGEFQIQMLDGGVDVVKKTVEYNENLLRPSGHPVCVWEGKFGTILTVIGAGILAAVDFVISIACLYLLALPIGGCIGIETGQVDRKTGAHRNTAWALAAILSTVAFFIFLAVMEERGTYFVGLELDVGVWDILINIVSINMTWP
eukprot:CAMPEP_0170184016 /NCGR_PEP_ID=MMETSP0040_2-20121228/32516_1 /TAXON_ID=641309 /ORGANISM="Lotharella oceanica, Strain CCMP622" /LENGTH=201 /DNA_ID=CAMNT_0010429937 /DNA_START=17 /DNA_END=620 /DNA_ORIENTATION=-